MIGIYLDVVFLASIKTIVGKDRIALEINSNQVTLENLITELANNLGHNFRDLIINAETKEVNPEILIFIENREIQTLKKLKTPLSDGNQIVFLSSIHGGFGVMT